MGLLSWLVIGLVVGTAAVLGSRDRGVERAAVALCAGVVGALVGGLLFSLFRWGSLAQLHAGSAVLALVGAALAVVGAAAAQRGSP